MLRKNEPFTISAYYYGTADEKVGSVEYQMSQTMADELLKSRKGSDKNMRPQDYLVKYINTEGGLLYNCVKVTTI